MTFDEWEQRLPASRREDPLWRMRVHRLASYLAVISWDDAVKLASCKITIRVSGQLYSAVGSIAVNLAEGYSRGSGRDRARLFEYALGSAREAREWYFRSEPVLGDALVRAREDLLNEIIRMLLVIIPRDRERDVRSASKAQ